MTVLDNRTALKPFSYPWAYAACKRQHQIHWMPEEIPMAEDVRDWHKNLNNDEKEFLTQIFRFFTQADIDVASGYIDKFMPLFKPTEVRMMMTAFAAMEGIHIDAYSTLIETVGMPDSEYQAFLEYDEMKAKHEYLDKIDLPYGAEYAINPDTQELELANGKEIAKALAIYAAFTEGLQLFSSFIMLLNFPRFGKMKGMGQIITWSIRDESLHVESMMRLFREFINEHPHLWTDEFKGELYQACRDMVELEDGFIDLAFKQGGIHGLDKDDVKLYVRHIADRRLLQLGLKPNFGVKEHPLPWVDEILNGVEHSNFFETKVTEYSKGTLTGSWGEDVWGKG